MSDVTYILTIKQLAKKTAFSHFQTLNFNLFCISRQRCKSAKGSIGICCWSNLNSKGGGDFIGVQKLHQMPKSRGNNADLFCMFFLYQCVASFCFFYPDCFCKSLNALFDWLNLRISVLFEEEERKKDQIFSNLLPFHSPGAEGHAFSLAVA